MYGNSMSSCFYTYVHVHTEHNVSLALACHPEDPGISRRLNNATSLLTASEKDSAPRNEEGKAQGPRC